MYDIFVPKSEELKQHIYNFCVLQPFKGKTSYLAFPQMGTTMAFYSQSDIKTHHNHVVISKSKEPNAQVLLLGKYTLPLQLTYPHFTPEISINFTPTGLNHFFKDDTATIAKNLMQLITQENWIALAMRVFNQKNNDSKMEVLEDFLLENLIKKELTLVEQFIDISNENPALTVSQIADELQVSTKTINRRFTNYVGCSPTDFKKIVRFRKAINFKFNKPASNLTQVCFEASFYDSPHFTKEFKKLTNTAPKDFFSSIENIAESEIPYKFL